VKIIVPVLRRAVRPTRSAAGGAEARRAAEGEASSSRTAAARGGAVGSELVAKAAPDGYTLVVSGIASHVIATAPAAGHAVRPAEGLHHIALFGGPAGGARGEPLAVGQRDVKDSSRLAKAKPGALSYGSPGNGTQGQLVAELFKRSPASTCSTVPVQGRLGSGHRHDRRSHPGGVDHAVHRSRADPAGRARGLAISAAARLPDYPDIPTFAESGYPDLVATVWFSLSGPPAAAADRRATERRGAARARALGREGKLRHEGITPNRLDAKEFTAFVADELRRWGTDRARLRGQERLISRRACGDRRAGIPALFRRRIRAPASCAAGA
jgi:tripartite-type tricarboxylate transporter receptor subunit TctC